MKDEKKNTLSQGISTYYYSNNFGALFQAISLRDYLKKINNSDINFDSYQPFKLFYQEIIRPMLTKNLKVFFLVLKKNLKLFFWRKKNNINFPTFFSKTKKKQISIYGSDEIWNFQNQFNGLDLNFFGFKDESKKIAYAVSIGRANLNKLDKEKKKLLSKYLNKFDFISVRDQNTFDFVYHLTRKSPEIVLDPCLLEEANFLNNANKLNSFSKGNYIVVYGNYFENQNIEIIKNYCKKNNLKIYSLSYFNEWVDENLLSIDGDDFLNLFRNAKMIFTSTFHGIVFSCKFKKNFWISLEKSKFPKYDYFIKYNNLDNRFIAFEKNLDDKINYDIVNNKIAELRLVSQKFLVNAINNINEKNI